MNESHAGVVMVVDCRSRQMNVCMASVTRMAENDKCLILRRAADIGTVGQMVDQDLDTPVLILGGYAAQSSAGYAHPLLGGNDFREVLVVGGIGFGKTMRGGLRCFSEPVDGILLPVGTRIQRVWTHSNSNQTTATAAYYGLKLRASALGRVVLVEGRSDKTRAFEFTLPDSKEFPEIPEEHNTTVISFAGIFDAAMGRTCEWKKEGLAVRYLVADSQFAIDDSSSLVAEDVSPKVLELVGPDKIRGLVKQKLAEYRESGWKFGVREKETPGLIVVAVSPDGVEAEYGGHRLRGILEHVMATDTINGQEKKRSIATKIRSRSIAEFFSGWDHGENQLYHKLVFVQYTDGSFYTGWFASYTGWRKPDQSTLQRGPDGQVSIGNTYLGLFMPDMCPQPIGGEQLWGEAYSGKMLEIAKVQVTAYNSDMSIVGDRVLEVSTLKGVRA